MKKIQKLLSLLLAIIMLAGALAGCAGGEKPAADTPKNGQTDEQTPAVDTSASAARDDIVIGLVQEPATLDPNNMSDGGGFMVAANIYEGLLWSTDDLKIEPLLAKSWDISGDGLVYTFHLEEDVKFHNGEPFTATPSSTRFSTLHTFPVTRRRLKSSTSRLHRSSMMKCPICRRSTSTSCTATMPT